MLIKEIEHTQTGGVNLENITREGEVPFGFNNELDGYEFYRNYQDKMDTYYLVDNNKVIAATAGKLITIKGTEYFQIKGVYVLPKYRGKHLGLKMYHAIKHIEKIRLMSDTRQTDHGSILWQEIYRKFPTKVMDLDTGEIISSKLGDAYLEPNYVLVTENVIGDSSIIIPPL